MTPFLKAYAVYATWAMWRLRNLEPETYLTLLWFALLGSGYAVALWGGGGGFRGGGHDPGVS